FVILICLIMPVAHAGIVSTKAISGCLSASRIVQLKKRFKVIDLGERLNLCRPSNRLYQLYYAMDYMDRLRFEDRKPLPPPFNQNIITGNWLNWMAAKVDQIYYGPLSKDYSNCRRNAPIVFQDTAFTPSKSGHIYLCAILFPAQPTEKSIIELITNMLHE